MDNLLFKSGNSGQVNVDQAQGIVECFVAGIGNKDSVGDIVVTGAFAKSLMRRKPRVVWGHSWNDPIGKVLEMFEVAVGDSRLPAKMRNAGIGGLYAKVQFNLQSEKGKEAFATVAFFGEDQEWSIGYKTIDSIFDPNLQANVLKELELYEVSPVLHGANQLTGTISIKADEKGHMPIIPMQGGGMPMMPMMDQMPRIVVVAAPNGQQDESSTDNPFAEGMSRELGQPDKNALQAELTDRTGSQIEVMNATENIVVFRRTTSDGKASMYRLPYHKEGNLYMFGKPEPYQAEVPQQQPMQNIQQKPGAPVVVPNGGIAYRNDDQQEMMNLFGNNGAVPFEKSDVSHLIELPESYMSEARDYLNPVLRHHKLAGRPSSKGIIIDGLLTANALDALQNAVKALGATIGQSIGKVRDLAQTFNPYALDGDGDGFVQDGSTFQRPYIPIKKPGFDLPDVRGRTRSGDSLLDKPKTTPKLPKDKNTWTRAQRNDALTSGMMEPETREDLAFLANRRPENEGVAKYWDMSAADLTVEGNKLVNARRQATGAEKAKIDEELLKVSHDFQRRASYSETFGQEFVPPEKREMPADMVPEADKPKPVSRSTDEPSAEVLAERRRERDLDRQADSAVDQALEQYIEEFGEDAPVPGFASSGKDPFTTTEVLMEVARRDGWRGGDKQPSLRSHEKAYEALNGWDRLSDEEKNDFLADNDELTIEQFVDKLLELRDVKLGERRAATKLRTDAERKRRSDEVAKVKKFARGDLSGVETNGLLDVLGDDTDDYGNASNLSVNFRDYARQNWKEMSQKERDTAMRDSNTVVDDPDSVVETLRDALMEYGYKNPKYRTFLDDLQSIVDEENERSAGGYATFDGLASGGDERPAERGRGGRLGSRPDDAEYRREREKQREKERVDRGSYPEDGKGAKAFDAILDKYWKMWGFDVPDADEEGQDEPFGFASKGSNEEVKQEKLDELVEGVRVRLLAELETADPATWKPSWRNDSLPINATTGKPYRGFNAFWLMLRAKGEQYQTGRYAGFNQLKARGAQVRKGEKGVPILRPQLVKVTDDEGNVKEFVKFRGTTVFNIDQADGGDEALRAVPADLPEEQRIAILDTTIAELGIDVRTANETPHYSPTEDYISMPEFAKGTSALEWSSTLAHETVHWTGGASRLNRPSVANYGTDKQTRAYEELVAEIGSAMLLAAHGIEAPFRQDHAPYIKGWLKLLTDDPDALGRAFKDAQGAINHLLEKSPNLRKLFGGLDNGKKAPDVDAPDMAEALVGASDGFASLHRVRTPRSEALTGILYDDNSGDLMVGFQKGKSWDKLTEGERENWIGKAEESLRDRGGLPLTDDIDAVAKDMYDDLRDTGWYVYSGVTMDEVEELAAVKSKGKHINALKKLKTARKATDEDSFNFFGRDERPQDVTKAKSTDGFASRGAAEPNEGLRRHKLMPAEVRKNLPDLYSTEDVPLEEKVLGAKFFSPYSNWTWYAVEFDGEDTFFGYVEGFENEWGNFSLNEIAGATLSGSLPAVERDTSFRPIKFGDLNKGDGFASSGSKKLGMEPRFTDPDWVDKTQQRILRSGIDFQSLSENDRIDWANSFLDEWLRENDMGYGLSDVANGKRISKRPDIDLLNYAEDAYARMSDKHASKRAQFGEETQGLASVGNRTRRLGIQPSEAVDYVSYDPDSESLFVAYKREDGRGDMYVYEGVDMDEAIGIENAGSVGRAINEIKRRKNVRKATPDEVIGLSNSDTGNAGKALRRKRGVSTATRVFDDARHSKNRDVQLEINADRISIDDDGSATWTSADDTMRYSISMDYTGGYTVTSEKLRSGGRDEPDEFETVSSVQTDSQPDAITALFDAAKSKIAGDIEEQELDRELADAKRELDMGGDAPGVISLDVTYSSALDAVDYNPSTQEMRVSFKDGGTYIYEGVDRETFDGFSDAPSKGRAMNAIKRAHPYRKDSEWAGGGDDDGGIEEFDVRGSAAVDGVSYNPEKEELTVVYTGGKGYVYTGVTREEANAVRSAPSKGRAINDVKRSHDVRNIDVPSSPEVVKDDDRTDIVESLGTGTPSISEATAISLDERILWARSHGDDIFTMMHKTYDSLLEKNGGDKRRADREFKDMFTRSISDVSASAVASGESPLVDEAGRLLGRWHPQTFTGRTDLIPPDSYPGEWNRMPYSDPDLIESDLTKLLKRKAGERGGSVPLATRTGSSIDPAPVAKPRIPTSKPPRGGRRVRNRNVVISMEQGDLGEIIEAESGGTTVDALRAARGVGKYTKGPRKGKRRGPDTIAVRDAETGELLHFNEIELTSSNANRYVGRKQGQSPTGKKRGFIRARSYTGRQNHKIVGDEGPSLRGEGKGMTEYDKRVYGLGSDEKNREFGLASIGSKPVPYDFVDPSYKPTPREELRDYENYLDSQYGNDFMDYTQMSDEEVKQSVMRGYRMSRSEANAFVKKLRKDTETWEDLQGAFYDSVDDEDGFASRSMPAPDRERRGGAAPAGAPPPPPNDDDDDDDDKRKKRDREGFASRNISRQLQFMELDKTEDWSDIGEADQQEWIAELELDGVFESGATPKEMNDIAQDLWQQRAKEKKEFVTEQIMETLDALRGGLEGEPDKELGAYGLDGISFLSVEEMIDNPYEADSSDYRKALKLIESMKDRIDVYFAGLPKRNDDDDDGFASLSRIKPGDIVGFPDDIYEAINARDPLIGEIAYDDETKELFVTHKGRWQSEEPKPDGSIRSSWIEPSSYIYENVSKEELDELGASRNLGESVNALKEIKTVRDATDEDLFNFNGREEKIEDVETRVRLEKLLLLETRRAKQAKKIKEQAQLDLSDEEFIADLLPAKRTSALDPRRNEEDSRRNEKLESDYRSLMEMSPSELAIELEKARDEYSSAKLYLNMRDGGVLGRDDEREGVWRRESYADAVERILARKLLSRDGMPAEARAPSPDEAEGVWSRQSDGFASRMPNEGERIMKGGNRDFLSDEFSSSEYRQAMSGLDKVRKGNGKVTPEEDAAIQKLGKLYKARNNTTTNQRNAINDVLNNVNRYASGRSDGFASRRPATPIRIYKKNNLLGRWLPEDVAEYINSSDNDDLRGELDEQYYLDNPGSPRPGARDHDSEAMIEDLIANPENYGFAENFRIEAIRAIMRSGGDRREAENMADYWIENDGIHAEYLKEADGDSLYAMGRAHDDYLDAFDDDGFASRYAKGDYATGYGASGFGKSNPVDPDWEFPSNFKPLGQNEDDYLNLPDVVRTMLWDMTIEKRESSGSWEDFYRESISLGASYRVPNVENQPNALNAWQLLAPSDGQRGQSGAYKQWNVKIVKNAKGRYEVIKSYGKLEDGDAISPRSNRGSLREQLIDTSSDYGRALTMARRAVSEKIDEGKGYRVTRTNDRGPRSERDMGPGLTQSEKDLAKGVATMRSGTIGSPSMSSRRDGDGFASRFRKDSAKNPDGDTFGSFRKIIERESGYDFDDLEDDRQDDIYNAFLDGTADPVMIANDIADEMDARSDDYKERQIGFGSRGDGFASRNVNREGSGLWGTNRPLDPDDPELSDDYIEQSVNDHVYSGDVDMDDLKKYNRKKKVSDEELQKLYDDYQSDDGTISDLAADTIENTFYNEIVDDRYDTMLEQSRSRYDYYDRDEDGFASSSTTKPSVDAETQKNIERASLGQLAEMIQDDLDDQGKKLFYGAVPYIDALSTMNSMDDRYGVESAQSIVAYTLSNLSTYRGAKARAIKAELKKRLDGKVDKDGFGSRGGSSKKYDSGWDGIIQSLETAPDMNAARAFPSWDDLDYDEQNEFVHELDYDYMYDKHGDLGDDGIVEAMETGQYDDEINEHAAMVWDTITERKEKGRLTAAVTDNVADKESIVDHWYNNDARHDEFLGRADGNLGEAMKMSYDEYLDASLDDGDGFASRASINESSTGQRIVPSRMHSDDRESLAEVTDPEERKERIDSLIEFYGSRIFAKPSSPRRKRIVQTQDENGFWVGPDGKPADFDDGFASSYEPSGGSRSQDPAYASEYDDDELSEYYEYEFAEWVADASLEDFMDVNYPMNDRDTAANPFTEEELTKLYEAEKFDEIANELRYQITEMHGDRFNERAQESIDNADADAYGDAMADRAESNWDGFASTGSDATEAWQKRQEEMERDPIAYFKRLVDSGAFDPDTDDAGDYIRDEGLPRYLLDYADRNAPSAYTRRYPESTATYGGSGLDSDQQKEILDTLEGSTDPFIQKLLRQTKLRKRLSDKQWAILKGRADREKKKTAPKKPSGFVSDVRNGGTIAPGARPVVSAGKDPFVSPTREQIADIAGLEKIISEAKYNGQALRFNYNGKEREVFPVNTYTNPKTGKVNMVAQDAEGVQKTFTIDKMIPSEMASSTNDGFASMYPRDEIGLEQFILQQEMELEDYAIMSELEPDIYVPSGLESMKKRIATAKRDLARIQKNKPKLVEEEEEFLASIDGFASGYRSPGRGTPRPIRRDKGMRDLTPFDELPPKVQERVDESVMEYLYDNYRSMYYDAQDGGVDMDEFLLENPGFHPHGYVALTDNERAEIREQMMDRFAPREYMEEYGDQVDAMIANWDKEVEVNPDEMVDLLDKNKDDYIEAIRDAWDIEMDRQLDSDGFASNSTRGGVYRQSRQMQRGRAGIQNVKREHYESDEEYNAILGSLQGRKNQNLGREIVSMDDGTGKMVPTEVFWGSKPNSEGVSAADDWAWDFAPKGEWMELGVGESSNVSRVWVKPNSDGSANGGYFGNEAMVMFKNGKVYKYENVTRPTLIEQLQNPSAGKAVREITYPDGEKAPFTVVGELSDAIAIVKGDGADYPDGYEADMADMAAQDVASNFTRLSKDDQNKYFQRALTNNADSGMTTDQILDEARKLAMDDRQMAMLERQAIGMGGSSKPRKIDVSSSSALNSVSYDEMNESLQVEYRGRDGQGTGTLYTYQGVTPDVVDRIEAADSRGATMREIRDNFEFTTSRKLPDSAYEGLASRGSRRSTSEMEDEVDRITVLDSQLNRMDPSETEEYRKQLISARNQAALEMVRASGLDPKNIRGLSVYDISTDEEDTDVLEKFEAAISDADERLEDLRAEKSIAEAQEQSSMAALSDAENVAKAVGNGSSERRSYYDSDEEYIDALRDDYDSLLGDIQSFVGDESEGTSSDSLQTYTLEHDTYMFTDETAVLGGLQERINSATTEDEFDEIQRDMERLMGGLVESHNRRYREDEARYDYDVPSVTDDDELEPDDVGSFLRGQDADGFASRGNRRRPGRRNQGGRGQRMAPKTSYTDEERQNLADGNILKSRTRPGKRRTGPSVNEFDGFASSSGVADLPTDERVIFMGGEHGPGKEISLNEMWRNYLKGIPTTTPGGRTRQGDKWGSTEPGVGATDDEFMERFGPDSPVGLDAESVRQLMRARTPGTNEVFIDDMYLADKLAMALSKEPTSLFGFYPTDYYDDDGKAIDLDAMSELNPETDQFEVSDEQMDAITEQERARRTARMAARGNRLGKRDLIQRRPTSSGGASSGPVGEMSLKEFEAKLQKTFGQPVRLTDDDGNALPAERMKANIEKSGIPFPFTSIEPFRQMQKRQILPYEYAKELVKLGVLDPSDLPARASSSLGEFSQWPGFTKANVKMPAVLQALAEVGIDIGETNRRSIQQGLSDAKKGALRKINTSKFNAKTVLIPIAKLKEMVERLGLDADEFAKWFGSTFTPSADKN